MATLPRNADINIRDVLTEPGGTATAFFQRWLNNLNGRVTALEATATALSAAATTGGFIVGTTNGSGQLIFAHGRPTTPAGVSVQIAGTAARTANLVSFSSTQITAYIQTFAGAPVVSTSVTVSWLAFG